MGMPVSPLSISGQSMEHERLRSAKDSGKAWPVFRVDPSCKGGGARDTRSVL